MAGIEDVVVEWAPSSNPIVLPDEPTWETLTADWQLIKTSGGVTTTELTQVFGVGSADIRVRNGDQTGRVPVFLTDGTSYKGINIRVMFGAVALWRGRIDRVEFDFTDTPFAAFVTLHCVDTLGSVQDSAVPDELFPDTVDYFTQVTDVDDGFGLTLAQAFTTGSPNNSGEFSHQLVKAPDKFEDRQGLLDFLNQLLLTEGATLFASPDEERLILRGRWDALRLLSSTTPSIIFTDGVGDGMTSFPYRRDDLEFADGDESFVNSVQAASKYLNKTVTEQTTVPGQQRVKLSRTDLITIRQGWVEANALMWLTLYNQTRTYPKQLKFLVATHGLNQATVYTNSLAPQPLFDKLIHVLHTPPGTVDQITYRLAVASVEHDIDRQRWLCTLGFTSLDRWWFGYGNGTDPIELVDIDGDADHGIDSGAIIAP